MLSGNSIFYGFESKAWYLSHFFLNMGFRVGLGSFIIIINYVILYNTVCGKKVSGGVKEHLLEQNRDPLKLILKIF